MISDPRQYTTNFPKTNIVISQALQVINKTLSTKELDDSLANILQKENDALINVAINLSPNVEVCKVIWDSLNRAINNVDEAPSGAHVFAIPLILVAGSKTKAKIKGKIDVEKLNELFINKGLFKEGSDSFISGKLIDPQKVAGIKQSQLYYWARNLQKARLWLPIEMESSPLEVVNEGVFLRFLIGVSIDNGNGSGLNVNVVSNNLMELMQLINAELKTDGVTLFPIPFTPIPLSSAFAVGNDYRTEVAIQVALSNIVRKIREDRFTPIARISQEGEAVKIVVTTKEESDLTETSLWNMTRFDDFGKTLTSITNLLHDIGVEWDYVVSSH